MVAALLLAITQRLERSGAGDDHGRELRVADRREAVDLVVMVMRGMVSSKFKVGAGVSVAAGPVGREISARTNYTRTNYKCSMKFLPFVIMRHFRRRRLSGA
jgi:hypothetical protein